MQARLAADSSAVRSGAVFPRDATSDPRSAGSATPVTTLFARIAGDLGKQLEERGFEPMMHRKFRQRAFAAGIAVTHAARCLSSASPSYVVP